MHFKIIPSVVAALIGFLLFPAITLAQDPGYGPAQDVQWQSPGGTVNLRAWPWQTFDDNQELDAWLLERRLFAVPGEKVLDKIYEVTQYEGLGGEMFLARDLRRKRGKNRFSLLYACAFENENEFVRLIDIRGELAIVENDDEDFWPVVKVQVSEWCEQDPDDARDAALLAEITTPPGQGIQPDEIEVVLGIMRESWVNFYQIDVDVYVLLRNGQAVRSPSRPVSDLNQVRARELGEIDYWTEWRKQNGDYQIKGDEGWTTLDVQWTVEPVPQGTRLSGDYEFNETSGNPWYGTFITNANYTFRENGTYSSSSSSQYGSGIALSDTLGSINTYAYCNEEGGGSVLSAAGPNTDASGLADPSGTPSYVGGSSRDTREGCGDGKGGVYTLDGYMIELQANNGVTQRLPFYQLSDAWIVVNWRWYAK